MPSLLIQNCDVLRRDNGAYHIALGQDIWIEGNRIKVIVPTGAAHEAAEIFPAPGMLAIPGLINTHAHVPMVLFREAVNDVPVERWFNDYIWQLETNLTPEDVYWGALLGQAEMIENGVTCVADRYFYMDHVAQATQESGMRANLVWTYFSKDGDAKLDEVSQFVERWQGGANGRITTWLGPHSPYTVSPEFLKLTAQRAQDLRVGIHIHVSETQKQVDLSMEEFGVTPVRLLADTGVLDAPTILGHCKFPTPDDMTILARVKTGVAHAPKTYLKHAGKIIDIAAYRRAGIPVGLATDGAASNSTLDIFEQMRLMALTQKYAAHDATVMPIDDALDVAFHGGAQVMQMENEIGELAPHRLADIVLLRQDGLNFFPPYNRKANLIYTVRPQDVDTVICDGRFLFTHGKHQTIDVARVMREIAPRLERLSNRDASKRMADYPT
jgi:5-methylthioadenosine/S-adenosylhomocysteine deaminase